MRRSIVILVLLLYGCGASKKGPRASLAVKAPPEIAMSSPVVAMDAVSYPANDKGVSEDNSELIMKSASVRFQVDNVEKCTKKIEGLVLLRKGLIARQNLSTESAIANELVIRVPSSSFEELLEDLSKQALFVNYKRIYSENVTEEYVDIQARLKTKREVRERYTAILQAKAKTVEDILKAEEHIRVLQEEIEAKEGRLNFLKSRVSMSEINLEIYQKTVYKETPAIAEKPYSKEVTEALGNGWALITSITLVLINSWPLIIAGAMIYWAWRRRRRRILAEEGV